jgi:hypothetical protein
MTLENALVVAVSTLTTAVGVLSMWFKSQFTTVEEKLKDCEDDREKLWNRIAELTGEASMRAMHCPKPDCPAKATFALHRKTDA